MGQNEKYSEMRKKPMEYRKVFDTIPEQFDKFRPRYSAELFEYFIREAGIGTETKVLEIGPGTGQATDPILDTGCDYNAIELGEHLYEKMKEKYDTRPNFHIVNDDFITHDFGEQRYDVIYSAATIQWIPEDIAFSKTYALLKPGGILLCGLGNEVNYLVNDDETMIVNSMPFNPLVNEQQRKQLEEDDCGMQFSHTVEEQLGGQLEAGFVLTGIFGDTNGEGRLHEMGVETYLATRAVKPL